MAKRKRDIQLKFRVTPQEREMIETKMAQFGTTNMAAYLRKMAIDGYVVKLDLPELRELVSLLRYSSNNLNQLTRLRQTGHHIRLFPDGVALQGGDEKDRRPLPAHRIDQLLIERVHTHSHQYTILHVPGLRDEACQHVLCGILVLDALRQTDTALLHAEDKGTLSLRLAKGRHVEILHEHTHRPHQAHRQQGG